MRAAAALLVPLAVAVDCVAAADDLPTQAGLSLFADADSTWSADASVDMPLGPSWFGRVLVGQTHVEADCPPPVTRCSDVDFTSLSAGIGRSTESWSADLTASIWGDTELARSTDLRLTAGYIGERFDLTIAAVAREVDVRVQIASLPARGFSLDARGAGLELGVRPSDSVRLYVGFEDQHYDDLPTVENLPLRERARRVTVLRLQSRSSSFPDHSLTAGVSVDVGLHRLSAEYLAEESAFQKVDSSLYSAGWQLPLDDAGRFRLELRAGVSTGDQIDSASFGSLSLTALL